MTIFTDKGLKHNCTVITVVRRHTGVDNYGHCCASGPNTIEEEKVEKYKHLALEINSVLTLFIPTGQIQVLKFQSK